MTSSKRLFFVAPVCLAAIGAVAFATPATAPEGEVKADLTLIPKGISKKLGYPPQRLALSASKPQNITKEPDYKHTPMYGALPFGSGERKIALVLDEAADASEANLYLDANNDGDLTNDAPVTWKRSASKTPQGVESAIFAGDTDIAPKDKADKAEWLTIGLYRFAPELAKSRRLPTDILLYYRDYARSGKLTLGGKTYNVLLMDERAAGEFGTVAHGEKEPARVRLLVDRIGNGKFQTRAEQYDLAKPFNIGGTTYEVSVVSPDGSSIHLKPSNKTVAEIPLPPDVGQPALAFTRPLLGGKTVSFPGDYKGKVVMLDFWATWCGPCIREIPGLVAAYEKYNSQGFEVLGISLDQPNQEEKVKTFLKAKKMPWAQVYDGKYWQAEIGQLYSVDSIPRAFLVDGDTGKIIATTADLRGDALEKTLERVLKAKAASSE